MDWAGDAEVECEESVVLAEMVTAAILAVDKASVGVGGAARRSRRRQSEVIRYGLSGVGLHADIGVKAPRQIRDGVEVEFVALVAIGVGILRFEVVEIGISKSERVALVGVVIFIDGISIVGVEEETMAHALAEAEGDATIERLSRADRVGNCAEVGEWCSARIAHGVRILGDDGNGADIRIGEASEVYTFG